MSGDAAAPRPRLRRPARPGVWPGPGGSVYFETLVQIYDLLNDREVYDGHKGRMAWQIDRINSVGWFHQIQYLFFPVASGPITLHCSDIFLQFAAFLCVSSNIKTFGSTSISIYIYMGWDRG